MPKTLIKKITELSIEDKAPDFEALDQEGKKISLKQFKGKTIVLYFYPKDNTPGCTKEACSLKNRYTTFKKKNVVIIGISKDSEKSHQSFIEKHDLPFTLLADTDKKVQMSYKVWKPKVMYGKQTMGTIRTTYIIGPDQKIKYIFNKVDCENHAEEVLEKLEELNLI
ncbi:MAG: thioredoxin-dependent thiol peroxidase [Candidatus Melainabacteria bacterium]|nr:thioredoxin-dependent thiol peroxidase [Candidatus Melainabacteria bacterium]